MKTILLVHKNNQKKANDIAVSIAGPQAKNTFDVPYEKDWFVASWNMKPEMFAKLDKELKKQLSKDEVCTADFKKKKKELEFGKKALSAKEIIKNIFDNKNKQEDIKEK